MGLDMYLSAKRAIPYKGEQDLYFKVQDLFGSFTTEPEAVVSFYVSNWRHSNDKDEARKFNAILKLVGLTGFVPDSSPSGYVHFDKSEDRNIEIDFHVGYWRKSNQVHNWFVENVQGGEDECNPFPASRDKLRELAAACRFIVEKSELKEGEIHVGDHFSGGQIERVYEPGKVVVNPEVAQEYLPTGAGFFFGSTDYDEWYIRDLEETVAMIEKALTLPEKWSFVYQSSW